MIITNLYDLFQVLAEVQYIRKYPEEISSTVNPFFTTVPVGLCCVLSDLYYKCIISRRLYDRAIKLVRDTFQEDANAHKIYGYYFGLTKKGKDEQRVAAALLLAEISRRD